MSRTNLPKLRKIGFNNKKEVVNGQTTFKLQDCMSEGAFDLLNRIRKCASEIEVTSLISTFKLNGYNRIVVDLAKNNGKMSLI